MSKHHNAYAVQFRTKKVRGMRPAGDWKTECWVPMYEIDGEDGKPYTMGHRIYLGSLIASWHVDRINYTGTLEARAVPVYSEHYADTEGDRIEFQAVYATESVDSEEGAA